MMSELSALYEQHIADLGYPAITCNTTRLREDILKAAKILC